MSNALPSTQDCHWNSLPDSCHITTLARILSRLDTCTTQLWSHRVADTLTHTAALSPRKRDRLAQQKNAEPAWQSCKMPINKLLANSTCVLIRTVMCVPERTLLDRVSMTLLIVHAFCNSCVLHTCQHMPQHSTAQHSTAQHSTAHKSR
jgi:hypothetical protein